MAKLWDRNFLVRVASAAVLLPLVIFALYSGGIVLNVLMAFAAMVMLHEWWNIVAPRTNGVQRAQWIALGVLWVVAPILSVHYLRQNFGFMGALTPILLIIITDTTAYIGGRLIGGKKLAPSISPGKTWSGLLCGAVCAGIYGVLLMTTYRFTRWPEFFAEHYGTYTLMFVLSFLFGCISQASDLLQSKFKRHFGVKDSGNIIPGHGGLLDRTDSMVLTLPLYCLAVYIFLMSLQHGG